MKPAAIPHGISLPLFQSLTLDYTNLTGLEQLNALASLGSSLKSLSIPPWGNPVTSHTFFFPYALFRLCHLGLTELNGSAIETTDVTEAERLFGNLGRLTTTQLPQARLLSLVTKYRSGSAEESHPHAVPVVSFLFTPGPKVQDPKGLPFQVQTVSKGQSIGLICFRFLVSSQSL